MGSGEHVGVSKAQAASLGETKQDSRDGAEVSETQQTQGLGEGRV